MPQSIKEIFLVRAPAIGRRFIKEDYIKEVGENIGFHKGK